MSCARFWILYFSRISFAVNVGLDDAFGVGVGSLGFTPDEGRAGAYMCLTTGEDLGEGVFALGEGQFEVGSLGELELGDGTLNSVFTVLSSFRGDTEGLHSRIGFGTGSAFTGDTIPFDFITFEGLCCPTDTV